MYSWTIRRVATVLGSKSIERSRPPNSVNCSRSPGSVSRITCTASRTLSGPADHTTRPQTVSRRTSPLYWELIECFRAITGVPGVLNTSFNVKDEPIVCTPRDALRCFYGTGMDALAIGDCILEKPA